MADDITPAGDPQGSKSRFRFGRGDKKAKPQAVKQPKPRKAASSGGLKQWLVDTYNGLFKIVIQPQLPSLRTQGLLLLAFLFGMVWAYAIAPTTFFDASFHQLSQGQREQYVRLVAASYEANFYTEDQVVSLLRRVENPGGVVTSLIERESGQVQSSLMAIQPLAQEAGAGTPAPRGGGLIESILTFVVALVVFVVLANVISLLWGLIIGGYVERLRNRFKPKSEADLAAAKEIEAIRHRRELEARMREESTSDASTSNLGPPLTQRVSTYAKGRGYDDSFAIEDANDMFLGECGATIARTIGDSQDVAAVEVWVFDKDDFVKTFTKIFVSQHGYNDPVIRSELDPKVENPATDIIVMQPGALLMLETDNLAVQAKIADMQIGADPSLPPNSYVESLTLQMTAWQKAPGSQPVAAAAAAPSYAAATQPMPPATGQRPLDEYEIGPPPAMPPATGQRPLDEYEIGPPPAMPPAAGQRPLDEYEIGPPPEMPPAQPPPPSPAPYNNPPPAPARAGSGSRPPLPSWPPPPDEDEEDDDPFGGTGDFTPIGR